MWGPAREALIAGHVFFVKEARSRLLDPFTDEAMRADADRYAQEWLNKMAAHFNPDRDDPSDHYEQSWDEGIAFYLRLDDLRKSTRLSIIAGMYQEWEKQLREWLTREVARNRPVPHLVKALWTAKIGDLFDFLESWGWLVRSRAYFPDLELCQLVVNVFKHGGGTALEALRSRAPRLVGIDPDDPLRRVLWSMIDHTRLDVEDGDLDRFSDAIVAFWRDVPENTFQSQIANDPAWIRRALEKDFAQTPGWSLRPAAPAG